MTDAPVPLAEQIEEIRLMAGSFPHDERPMLKAVLATLQQHRRLVEVLIRFRDDATGSNETLNALWDALDAAGALNVK